MVDFVGVGVRRLMPVAFFQGYQRPARWFLRSMAAVGAELEQLTQAEQAEGPQARGRDRCHCGGPCASKGGSRRRAHHRGDDGGRLGVHAGPRGVRQQRHQGVTTCYRNGTNSS